MEAMATSFQAEAQFLRLRKGLSRKQAVWRRVLLAHMQNVYFSNGEYECSPSIEGRKNWTSTRICTQRLIYVYICLKDI